MKTAAYRYRARLVRAIDGDTYVLEVDLGFRVAIQLEVRLRDVDTPEMNTTAGRAAQRFAAGLLTDRPLIVETFRDRRSFTRWVADCWVADTGESVADVLVRSGHAVRV